MAITILRNRLFYWSTIPALIAGALVLLYYANIRDYPVFPNADTFNYNFYNDGPAGGDSKIIKQEVTDSLIRLDYQISNKINTPYAGLSVGPKGSKSIDLGNYNQLTIRLKGHQINGIGIALVTQNSLKANDKERQGILFYHIFKILPGIHTYQISTDKFEVPGWWGESNRIEDASAIQPDLKVFEAINVNSAFTDNRGIIQSFEIYSMAFSRNNKSLIYWIIFLEIAFVLLVFSAFYLMERMKEQKQTITITYQPIENKETASPRADYIDFINKNFHNPQLTLEYISQETGVSQRRITSEMHSRFDCNIKTYINRLRLNESKRMLIETDLPIGEITYRVGFNNQTHFNRVFKAEMQISPTDYRSQNKK